MRVPRALIKYYFDYVISDYLDENQEVPSDMCELDEYLPNLKALLKSNHEQLSFFWGLKEALKGPDSDLQKYYGYDFPLENEEIRNVMEYLLKVVLPNEIIGDEPVEITEETIENDRIERGVLYKVKSEQTLESIAASCGLNLDVIKLANPYWNDTLGSATPLEVGKTVKLKLSDEWH